MTLRGADYTRQPLEDYSTPLYVLRSAIPLFDLARTVVDPCSGKGNVVRAIRETGRRAIGYDVKRKFDFLSDLPPLRDYDIFTNPPYGPGGRLGLRFIERALVAVTPWRGRVVFLLPVDFDSGVSRRHVFADCPAFARKIVLLRRIRWFGEFSGSTNHAWFEWDLKRTGDLYPTIDYSEGELDAKAASSNPARPLVRRLAVVG